MRVLILTQIFPNLCEPTSAPFNRQQFAHLSRLCDVNLLAAIPWYPGATALSKWSRAGRLTDVPSEEIIDGNRVEHPRFLFIPKFGRSLTGPLYAASLAKSAMAFRNRVDVILGSWAYPDGYAAVMLSRLLGAPAVIKLHGSDINVLSTMPGPRRGLKWALPRARRVVAVSSPLREAAIRLGAPADRVDVILNGIDRERFQPRDRDAARRALDLPTDRPLALYVGRIERSKGSVDLVRAFADLRATRPNALLVMVGDGAARAECESLAAELGANISFVGAKPHAEVPSWLAACDVMVLPSWNEGTPNVVLEALASGRRVVATAVGGTPDVVRSELQGTLVPAREPGQLAVAIGNALDRTYDPHAVAASLDTPDWEGSARRLHDCLAAACHPN